MASVGVRLRQRQAQKPIRPAKTSRPRETSGRRNWNRHKSTKKHQAGWAVWRPVHYDGYMINLKNQRCRNSSDHLLLGKVVTAPIAMKWNKELRQTVPSFPRAILTYMAVGLTCAQHVLSTVVISGFLVFGHELLLHGEASAPQHHLGAWDDQNRNKCNNI